MQVIPGEVIIDTTPRTPPPSKSQPIEMVAPPPDRPELADDVVRQAIAVAEANNIDPQSLTFEDLAKGIVQTAQKPVVVPEKFKTPDGAVDVEKIQASTQALDTAIQKKEEAITRTVDDYMREYTERETKFRNMPNPQRLQAQVPQQQPIQQPVAPTSDYEEIVRRDYAADPLGTTTRLLDLMIQQKFQPLEERKKAEDTRTNLQALAAKDPRILREDVFAKVNEKLQSDPDFWKLKNPHKSAWLEVKEEMRLGEYANTPAQPSRPSAPVLGGGTPPSAPSHSSVPSNGNFSIDSLDLRNKDQEALGDEAIRRQLAGLR
jgi:hypothetical protein